MSIVTSRFFTFSEIKKESDTTVQNRDIRPGSLQCVFSSLIASATYMLQQRLELLSYSGIAQKAAFWLLMQISGKNCCKNPGFHVQMGNDHECIQAVFSQGNEKAGKGWNHSVHGQDH